MTTKEIRNQLDIIESIQDRKLRQSQKRLGALGFRILCEHMKKLSRETKADILDEICDAIQFDPNEYMCN